MSFGLLHARHLSHLSITPYISWTRYYDTEKWLSMGKRSFDERGILLQSKDYHPLGIATYGIMRYEDFLRTGDSSHYHACVAQFAYFLDRSLTDSRLAGFALALPYRFEFKDMPLPWYSGMTQGAALSYLMRYHDLTGDARAIPLARRIARWMLMPEEWGGGIGVTPEGMRWIEEYPGSKRSPQVLNGFINGLIGLKEYCDWFPEAWYARQIHDQCFAAMRSLLYRYDRPNTTSYHRSKILPGIRPEYLRYQLQEMDHLFAIYGDAFLLRQFAIWSRMEVFRPDPAVETFRNPQHEFMLPMFQANTGTGWQRALSFDSVVTEVDGYPVAVNGRMELPIPKGRHYLRVFASCDSSELTVRAGNPGIIVQRLPGGDGWEVSSEEPIQSLSILPTRGKVHLRSIQVLDDWQLALPRIVCLSPLHPVELKADRSYRIAFHGTRIQGLQFLYRWSPDPNGLKDSIYRHDRFITLEAGSFSPPADGHYEAFPFFPLTMPNPEVSQLEIVEE